MFTRQLNSESTNMEHNELEKQVDGAEQKPDCLLETTKSSDDTNCSLSFHSLGRSSNVSFTQKTTVSDASSSNVRLLFARINQVVKVKFENSTPILGECLELSCCTTVGSTNHAVKTAGTGLLPFFWIFSKIWKFQSLSRERYRFISQSKATLVPRSFSDFCSYYRYICTTYIQRIFLLPSFCTQTSTHVSRCNRM